MANIVFIATSLDGYIADREGSIAWLNSVPNPEHLDTGFAPLMERVDALIMGRNTFETVLSFGVEWPYTKPVFVLSNSLTSIPADLEDKAFLLKGELKQVIAEIHAKGLTELYIDGGITIQHFLRQDLIDELVITQFPILLGGGFPLFGELAHSLDFELIKTEVVLKQLTQSTYLRKR